MNSGEIFEAPPSNAEAATASAASDKGTEKSNSAGADANPSTASNNTTASPTPAAATGVTLEQEMSQAFGALRGFWGRSTKSFGSVVLQAQERAQVLASQATVAAATVASQATTVAQNAQREIERLGAAVDAAVEDAVTERERVTGAENAAVNMGIIGTGGSIAEVDQSRPEQGIEMGTQLGNGEIAPPVVDRDVEATVPIGEEAGGFLARLQAGLPPNVAQTLKALEAAASSGEAVLATRAKELQAQLAPTLQRVQSELGAAGTKAQEGLVIAQTRAQGGLAAAQEGWAPTLARVTSEVGKVQAELQKTVDAAGPRAQGLLKDAGVFFSEAVKVVPPPEGSSSQGHVVAWDGLDIWTPAPEADESAEYFDDKGTGTSKGKGTALGLGRTEAMLRRVRTDESLYTVALTAEEETEFTKLGDEDKKPIADGEQDPELKALVGQLVPEKLTAEAFWARYRFRVYQVAQDEEKRKALLAAQAQNDEELFAWDDDEEAGSPSAATRAEKERSMASSISGISSSPAPTLKGASSGHRERDASESEASYDLVSGAASPAPARKEDVKEAKGASPTVGTTKKVDDEDGDDSDWE